MSPEALVVQTESETPAIEGFRHTRWFLIAYYLIFVMWGFRNAWPTVPSRLDIMVPLALYAVASWWVIVDARARGRAVPLLSQQWFFLGAVLLVPVYVIWSRGWRGVGHLFLHVVLGYVLATVCMIVTVLLIHLSGLGASRVTGEHRNKADVTPSSAPATPAPATPAPPAAVPFDS